MMGEQREGPFSLTESEKHSDLWMKIKAHYEQKLQETRVRNDKPLDAERKMVIVGQLMEMKYLLSLEQSARPRADWVKES